MKYRVGIDVGGTFTDLLLVREDGSVAGEKTSSTPPDFSQGILMGLGNLAAAERRTLKSFLENVDLIVHGTTAVTNAILTRRGAETGLLTTRGFRDALAMRRGVKERIYDNKDPNPEPLVPRYRRLGVGERVYQDGTLGEALDAADVRSAVDVFIADGVRAVAICFLNSYVDGRNETQCRQLVEGLMPGAYVSVSHELLPKVGFYDRLSTTVINAFAGPVFADYLATLTAGLGNDGFSGALLVMLSSGGVVEASVAALRPAAAVGSGPAGGAVAGVKYAEVHGFERAVTFDMGGTSLDVACIVGGRVGRVRSADVNRFRIAMPMVDLVSIGAGGGSIARVDAGGLLHVGPESAAADPGPACYGRGGRWATVTDADLSLGLISPEGLLGGRLPLDKRLAAAAIEEHVGKPLGVPIELAARAIYDVINVHMASAVREFLYERGYDPAEFALVVAGGAGPLHACAVASELGIQTVIVPRESALFSAVGLLLADLKHDYVQTAYSTLEDLDPATIGAIYRQLGEQAGEALAHEGIAESERRYEMTADLRYERQVHEIEVAVLQDDLGDMLPGALASRFHDRHRETYGFNIPNSKVEFVNARLSGVGRTPPFWFPELQPFDSAQSLGSRQVYFGDKLGWQSVSTYQAHDLGAGIAFDGPALIESARLSVWIPDSWHVRVDQFGNFLLVDAGGQGPGVDAESTRVGAPLTGTTTS
jgi:N-methylhydantoinase A